MVSKEDFEKAVDEYEKGNEKLLRKIIIPAEIVSEVYPVIEVKKEFVNLILHGSPIYYKFLEKKKDFETGKIICVFGDENVQDHTGQPGICRNNMRLNIGLAILWKPENIKEDHQCCKTKYKKYDR